VFRTGVLDSASASDIGIPAVCFRQLHAEPARAAIEQAGGTVVTQARVGNVSGSLELALEQGSAEADAVIVAVPHEAVGSLVPAGAVDLDALAALGSSPIVNLHVHYDRAVLREPLAAAIGSPVQWLFDRTAASGAREGQLVAVSLSHAVEEIGASSSSLAERYLPALERLLPEAAGASVLDFAVTHSPRATFRIAPRTRRLRPQTATSIGGLFLAGAWTDTGWPPTMEGAVRSGLAAARAALANLDTSRARLRGQASLGVSSP
jgi:monoamine oxidase